MSESTVFRRLFATVIGCVTPRMVDVLLSWHPKREKGDILLFLDSEQEFE